MLHNTKINLHMYHRVWHKQNNRISGALDVVTLLRGSCLIWQFLIEAKNELLLNKIVLNTAKKYTGEKIKVTKYYNTNLYKFSSMISVTFSQFCGCCCIVERLVVHVLKWVSWLFTGTGKTFICSCHFPHLSCHPLYNITGEKRMTLNDHNANI